jgi:translation initiation factor 3 subunit K
MVVSSCASFSVLDSRWLRSVPQLEAYLSEQVSTSTYDFEANKALLKLYQFFPDLLKEEVVTQLVVKSLMNLPSMDLRSLLSIAPESALRSTPVSNVKRAGDALEMAQFREFWEMQRLGDLSMAKNIAGFDDQVRMPSAKNVYVSSTWVLT